MGRQCEVSGKKTSFGNHVTTRGKAKYLGGVGTKPWRARRAETALIGGPAEAEAFRLAMAVELGDATVRRHNAFKLELATRAAVRALTQVAA